MVCFWTYSSLCKVVGVVWRVGLGTEVFPVRFHTSLDGSSYSSVIIKSKDFSGFVNTGCLSAVILDWNKWNGFWSKYSGKPHGK